MFRCKAYRRVSAALLTSPTRKVTGNRRARATLPRKTDVPNGAIMRPGGGGQRSKEFSFRGSASERACSRGSAPHDPRRQRAWEQPSIDDEAEPPRQLVPTRSLGTRTS